MKTSTCELVKQHPSSQACLQYSFLYYEGSGDKYRTKSCYFYSCYFYIQREYSGSSSKVNVSISGNFPSFNFTFFFLYLAYCYLLVIPFFFINSWIDLVSYWYPRCYLPLEDFGSTAKKIFSPRFFCYSDSSVLVSKLNEKLIKRCELKLCE